MGNPWEVDVTEIDKQISENKASSGGVICPQRNATIRQKCGVCQYILTQVYSKKYPENHPASNWAREKKAKSSIFFNAVLDSDRTKAIILRLGSGAGQDIINGIKNEGWVDLLNPKNGKGRLLKISKVKNKSDKYPKYTVTPQLEKADWEMGENIWKNLPNLDQENLINMIENNGFTDDNYFDISSLNIGDSLVVRLCPPWGTGSQGESNRRFCEFVWRHWGVSKDQVDGKESLNWREQEQKEENKDQPTEAPPWEDKTDSSTSTSQRRQCFGDVKYYEESDKACIKCPDYVECGNTVKDIPF